jgi:murein DD-endopeptidase MepM/ murein hydrolase activator NlpD
VSRVRTTIAAVALCIGVLSGCGGSEEGGGSAEEIRLDARTPAEARRPPPAVEEARKPRQASREEAPPAHILRENAKLRRELETLKALEAADRRVRRQLAALGTFDGPLQIGAGGLAWPMTGPVVSPFGQRWGRLHAGIDIAAPAGTPIRAAAAGRVAISGPTSGYGNYVCVQHNRRLTTCYAHLSRILAARGALLEQGDPIGLVGCTGHCFGDHLHFETRVDGRPTDPMPYL